MQQQTQQSQQQRQYSNLTPELINSVRSYFENRPTGIALETTRAFYEQKALASKENYDTSLALRLRTREAALDFRKSEETREAPGWWGSDILITAGSVGASTMGMFADSLQRGAEVASLTSKWFADFIDWGEQHISRAVLRERPIKRSYVAEHFFRPLSESLGREAEEFDKTSEYWASIAGGHEQKLAEGDAPWYRDVARWGTRTTLEVAKFVGAGAVAGPAGVHALVWAQANTVGEQAYKETGNAWAGVIMGATHGIATHLVFKWGGYSVHKSIIQAEKAIQGFSMAERSSITAMLSTGRTMDAVKSIGNSLNIFPKVATLRTAELLANSIVNANLEPHQESAMYRFNTDNFMNTLMHSLEEAAVFAFLPTAQKLTMYPFTYKKLNEMKGFIEKTATHVDMERLGSAFSKVNTKIESGTSRAELEKMLEVFESFEGSNMFVDTVKGLIKDKLNQLDGKAPTEHKSLLEEWNNLSRQEQTRVTEEFTQHIENHYEGIYGSKPAKDNEGPQADVTAQKQSVESNTDHINNDINAAKRDVGSKDASKKDIEKEGEVVGEALNNFEAGSLIETLMEFTGGEIAKAVEIIKKEQASGNLTKSEKEMADVALRVLRTEMALMGEKGFSAGRIKKTMTEIVVTDRAGNAVALKAEEAIKILNVSEKQYQTRKEKAKTPEEVEKVEQDIEYRKQLMEALKVEFAPGEGKGVFEVNFTSETALPSGNMTFSQKVGTIRTILNQPPKTRNALEAEKAKNKEKLDKHEKQVIVSRKEMQRQIEKRQFGGGMGRQWTEAEFKKNERIMEKAEKDLKDMKKKDRALDKQLRDREVLDDFMEIIFKDPVIKEQLAELGITKKSSRKDIAKQLRKVDAFRVKFQGTDAALIKELKARLEGMRDLPSLKEIIDQRDKGLMNELVTVFGKEYTYQELVSVINSKPKDAKGKKRKKAVIDKLKKEFPDLADIKTQKGILEYLEKNKDALTTVTKEESLTSAKERERQVRKDEANRQRDRAQRAGKKAIISWKRQVREKKDSIFNSNEKLDAAWNEMIKEISSTKAGRKLVDNLGLRLKDYVPGGSFKIRGKGSATKVQTEKFEKLAEKVEKEINKELQKSVNKQLETMLKQRKMGKQRTQLDPIFDNLTVAIAEALSTEKISKRTGITKESLKRELEEAFLDYSLYLDFVGLSEAKPMAINAHRIMEKASKGGKGIQNLTLGEQQTISMFLQALRDASNAKTMLARSMQRGVEKELISIMREEMYQALGRSKEVLKRDENGYVTSQEQGALGAVFEFVWSVSFGKTLNTGLSSTIEFLSGGTNTQMHRTLFKDIDSGLSRAANLERDFHFGLKKVFEDLGMDPYALMDSNHINRGKKDQLLTPHEIRMKDGTVLRLSKEELFDLAMQLQDAATVELIEKGNQIGLLGRTVEKSSFKGGEENLATIREYIAKETMYARAAEKLVDFLNSEVVVNPLREYGLRRYGIDIIESGRHVTRIVRDSKARIKEEKKEEGKKEETKEESKEKIEDLDVNQPEVGSLHQELSKEGGLAELMERNTFDTGIGTKRTQAHNKEVVIMGFNTRMNRYFHALSLLRHLEAPMEIARRVVRDKEPIEMTSEGLAQGRLPLTEQLRGTKSASMFNKLEKDFYSQIIKYEKASQRDFDAFDTPARAIRNNILKSGLGFHPAIMVYQPLSMYAAAVHLGEGGLSAFLKSFRDVGWKVTPEYMDRMERISGFYWKRRNDADAANLASGNQMGKRTMQIVAGKRRGRHPRNLKGLSDAALGGIRGMDNFAIVRIFRMTEIMVQKEFKNRGLDWEKETELYENVVRRQFERTVKETQPNFHPAWQTSIMNKARENTALSYMTMYRGYVAKLVEIQSRGFMRANRARANGNNKEAAYHLWQMAQMTLVSSVLIPVIRNAVRLMIVNAPLAFFNEDHEFARDVEREMDSLPWDIFMQVFGMPIGGEIVASLVQSSVRGEGRIETSLSPVADTFTQSVILALKGLNAIKTDEMDSKEFQKWIIQVTRAFATVTGVPTAPLNYINGYFRDSEEQQLEKARELRESLLMGL